MQPPACAQLRDGAGVGGARTDEQCIGSCAAQARRVPRGRRGVAAARVVLHLGWGAWLPSELTEAVCVSVVRPRA